MEIGQTDLPVPISQVAFRQSIEYLEEEIKIRIASPLNMEQEVKLIKDGLTARRKELDTTLGEITLIHCPVVNCPTHTYKPE
ncbi:hypothetical protein TNIN_156331 [Trichonephila inaurata madagascariensis]|uniref:Uncharacterized protein n=1 Tax=Trichonephila inaurata madagascariensis TaxID=2747483 RepID=A0A8X6X312_9ARAC|nr:hypothetical protein TNIN_156331 [Trichonephila inaurata madagascariensis]